MTPKFTVFAIAALRLRDLGFRHLEDLGGDGGVDVAVLGERRPQRLVAAEVGEQPQLDLRVVGGDQLPAVARDERLADLLALLACGPGCSAGSGRSN